MSRKIKLFAATMLGASALVGNAMAASHAKGSAAGDAMKKEAAEKGSAAGDTMKKDAANKGSAAGDAMKKEAAEKGSASGDTMKKEKKGSTSN